MKLLPKYSLLAISGLFLSGCSQLQPTEESLKFVVLGDTWYQLDTEETYLQLIDTINQFSPEFTVHIGDTRGSENTPCSDGHYRRIYDTFQRFENPLIYTPGDNEWTDCWERNTIDSTLGNYEPTERLLVLREVFYPAPESLGTRTLPLERQSQTNPRFREYVENQRWWSHEILFFTLHIPGSNNGWVIDSDVENSEYQNRQRANLAWLEDSFQLADSLNARAVVMFYHADLDISYSTDYHLVRPIKFERHQLGSVDGFKQIREAIKEEAGGFGKPVLQVYGDSHHFTYTQPYKEFRNVWRLQTFGYPDHRAVSVEIAEKEPWFFEVKPLY